MSVLLGTATAFLTFLMLREATQQGFVPGSAATAAALALLLGLGTVHFYLSVVGQVWFLSSIAQTLFFAAAILLLLRSGARRSGAVISGAAFAAAFLCRNNAITTLPFFLLAFRALAAGDAWPWYRTLQQAIRFSLPLIGAVAVSLAFNAARFGNPLDTGWGVQQTTLGHPSFLNDFNRYGTFSVHYLGQNLYYYFINPFPRRHPTTGAVTFDPMGNSMFLVTPALLYVLRASPRRNWFTLALWLGLASGMVLLLTFIATGWYQFGNRYFVDLMPLALLLVAIGLRGRLTRVAVAAITASIAINAWGTYRFLVEQP